MKKNLLLLAFILGYQMNAQTTIAEGKIDKEMPFFKFNYAFNSNKLYIAEAYTKNNSFAKFKKLTSYDADANKTVLPTEEFLLFYVSDLSDGYKTLFQDGVFASPSVTYYVDGKAHTIDKVKGFMGHHTDFTEFFNGKYQYRVVDEDGEVGMDFIKAPIFLERKDFIKNSTKTFSIKKPSVDRLQDKTLYKVKNISFAIEPFDENSFAIVTKKVDKEHTSSTMYRTVYDYEGKKLNDYAYSYAVPGTLVRIQTADGDRAISDFSPYGSLGTVADLDINDYYVDPLNGDVFIYGIYLNKKVPTGFYVIRYSKTGEKIWEKFHEINDKKGFNDKTQLNYMTSIFFHKYLDDDTFAISVDGEHSYTDRYNHFFLIDRETGEMERKGNMDSYTHTRKGTLDLSLTKNSIFEITRLKDHRYCEIKTLLAYTMNDKVKKHIDGVKAKGDVFFHTYVTSKGIWLLESDNDSYYKVTLFKD